MTTSQLTKGAVLTDWKARWKAAKTNGCSASPDLWMTEDCNNHDRMYAFKADEDGNPISRWTADWKFLKAMRKSAPGVTAVDRFIIRNTIPTFYWAAVRLFGWKYW